MEGAIRATLIKDNSIGNQLNPAFMNGQPEKKPKIKSISIRRKARDSSTAISISL